jgi:serine/threonine protein kinase
MGDEQPSSSALEIDGRERFGRIEQIYHEALKRPEEERLAFLAQSCAGEEDLRQDVERLLAYDDSAAGFLEDPAMEVAAQSLARDISRTGDATLSGRKLRHYHVLERIGAGGMGEVYRALDERLCRIVALKILPPDFASEAGNTRRFIREAKAASSLNHANIATVYEVGEAEGIHFIAMEYISGQTLAEWSGGCPLRPELVIEAGIQVADALDEAHEKGVIHRDLKPANMMVTARGQVKVLDFGLAKLAKGMAQPPDSGMSSSTQTGLVMGTVAYMSPEQVLGHELDHRTDIFSLGAVLYELVAGHPAFSGKTAFQVADRVLRSQPEPAVRFNDEVPPGLERIIRKCLEKDRGLRYRSARELLIDLKKLRRGLDSGTETVQPALKPRRALVLSLVLVAVLAVIAWLWLGR